jgi:hypothetical protein
VVEAVILSLFLNVFCSRKTNNLLSVSWNAFQLHYTCVFSPYGSRFPVIRCSQFRVEYKFEFPCGSLYPECWHIGGFRFRYFYLLQDGFLPLVGFLWVYIFNEFSWIVSSMPVLLDMRPRHWHFFCSLSLQFLSEILQTSQCEADISWLWFTVFHYVVRRKLVLLLSSETPQS